MAPPAAFIVGVFGNIISFMCFLAPLPTFYRVCKKKSTEGFQSVPYVAALFSAMLWIFYAYIKTGEFLIITINAFGCVIEIIYLVIYIAYCPKKARVFTLRLILLLNFGGICIIVLLTHLLSKERAARIKLLGWICVVFSTSVFVAPLSIIRVVIRTKSVEFMPFTLSLLLTVSAAIWLAYGVLLRDIYISLPNFVGLAFGTIQMVLYAVYRNYKPPQDQKLPEHKGDIENGVVATVTTVEEKQVVISQPAGDIEVGEKKENDKQDQTEQNNNNKTEGKREEISSKV
ncbi:bidirectional sugar transporter SWEET12 [Neltuma alba]|uniref:bidirectional sugar transporter SWEET12 n=1 Tax=Neltuma alba TaxID=207710 RepID=UPI0010A30459|nr:bidirectional sugar transporter SWEET12-like [Prosopis alba]